MQWQRLLTLGYQCGLVAFLLLVLLSIPLVPYTVCYLSHKPKTILTEKWRLFDDEQVANFYLPALYVESVLSGRPVRAAAYEKRHPEDNRLLIFKPVRSTPPGPNDPSAHFAQSW